MYTKIIAEIASCHNGSLEMAKAMIRAAAENGADIVKFQDWRASNVSPDDPDKDRYETLEFRAEWYPELITYCKEQDVEFLTTCFNADRAQFLANLGLTKIKLASISLTNRELFMAVGSLFEEVIVSTAMHTKEEIEDAIDFLTSNAQSFTIMHCVANYPTLPFDANLARIDALKEMVAPYEYADVGYSDHALDLDVAKAAMAKGIKYLEKHFSLSRYLPQQPHQMYAGGPLVTTHEVSVEPHELLELSRWRHGITPMVGMGTFGPNATERAIRNRYSNRYGQ